ncbi:MAG: DUF1549 and DUF1553 domain-containing protein [Verrucomicrobiaceae bacterium]|nr:DUF1549 and DUF1553 domain-containing protein [Verrucomicrobiaceae bacterium]
MKPHRLLVLLAVTSALVAADAPKVAQPAATPALASVSKTKPVPFPKSPPVKPAATPEPPLYESTAPAKAECEIDRLVVAKLKPLGVQQVLCSDAVFLRRVFLDVIGTLPTAAEARAFLEDTKPGKRSALIDQLLQRDEFAVYWAMKWSDLLRIKAEFPINLWPNAAQAYHHWVLASLEDNKPYDEFARELLTSSGSNFRVGPVNFYRAMQSRTPEGIASTVALTFMGVRTDGWQPEKLAGMAQFFAQTGYKPTSEWKEEYVFWDPIGTHTLAGNIAPGKASIDEIGKPASAPTSDATSVNAAGEAVFPDGKKAKLTQDRDPREVFADWLITPKNPWFTRNISNRVWSWLLGRGIIHAPDDLRENNPPSNPELLAFLEGELVKAKYDLKHLYRLILNSNAYQSSSLLRDTKPEAQAQFARYPLRRLDAELIIDAINKITATTELYTSAIPEPFTYIPQGEPAMSIGDGSITSPFLSLFGRSARATGMEDERSNKFIAPQWLHLLNSSQIQKKLEMGSGIKDIIMMRRGPTHTLEELYLTILSRMPTQAETENAMSYGEPPTGVNKAGKPRTGKRTEDWIDIAWSLLNSSEFLFRH